MDKIPHWCTAVIHRTDRDSGYVTYNEVDWDATEHLHQHRNGAIANAAEDEDVECLLQALEDASGGAAVKIEPMDPPSGVDHIISFDSGEDDFTFFALWRTEE